MSVDEWLLIRFTKFCDGMFYAAGAFTGLWIACKLLHLP